MKLSFSLGDTFGEQLRARWMPLFFCLPFLGLTATLGYWSATDPELASLVWGALACLGIALVVGGFALVPVLRSLSRIEIHDDGSIVEVTGFLSKQTHALGSIEGVERVVLCRRSTTTQAFRPANDMESIGSISDVVETTGVTYSYSIRLEGQRQLTLARPGWGHRATHAADQIAQLLNLPVEREGF